MAVSVDRRFTVPLLEIWDRSQTVDGVFGPDFRDLLLALPAEALALDWSIMDIGATPLDDDPDLMSLEARANESTNGLQYTGEELLDLSGQLLQVIDAIFVGYRGLAPLRSDPDLRRSAEIVIEAIDSTLWRVFAYDNSLREHLRRVFEDVREVPPEPIPAIHTLS